MNKNDFEKILEELNKISIKQKYIYLLQLKKYIKEKEILDQIESLLKEIEEKFSNDKSWKKDVLTTLISNGNNDKEEAVPLRNIITQAGVEDIIEQQPQKPIETGFINYKSSTDETKYGDSYFKKESASDSVKYSTIDPHENLSKQQEQFQSGGYSPSQKSLKEEMEEYQKLNKRENLYK